MYQNKVQWQAFIHHKVPYKPQISSLPLQWLLNFQSSGPVWCSPLLTNNASHKDMYRDEKHTEVGYVIDFIWKYNPDIQRSITLA